MGKIAYVKKHYNVVNRVEYQHKTRFSQCIIQTTLHV